MAKCDKNCLSCVYADCINDTVTAMDFLDIVDLEKALGVYQPKDFDCFFIELEFFVRRDRRREREAEKKARARRNKDGLCV